MKILSTVIMLVLFGTSSDACSLHAGCVLCVTTRCTWCTLTNTTDGIERGWCTAVDPGDLTASCVNSGGGVQQVEESSNGKIYWKADACPIENECETGRHNCNLSSEYCTDSESGFECVCKDGYERKNGLCIPVCVDECINGICIQPNTCQCHFGFVGTKCEFECHCSGHSACPGPQDLDNCLECRNHTKGSYCEHCDDGFLRRGNSCIPCREYCHGHTDICATASTYNSIPSFIASSVGGRGADQLPGDLSDKTSTPVVCVNCSNFTKGLQCEYCQSGYFRPPTSTPWMTCMRCECNGHSVDNVCNPQRGDGCECQNNTATPDDCKDECWMLQCSSCKDHFRGTPIQGRHCYREISQPDEDVCLVPDECSKFKRPRPLMPMEHSFFLLTPEYSSVDVRITLDVGQGNVDAFMAISDMFTVQYNETAGCHVLSWRINEQQKWKRETSTTGESDHCGPGQYSNWDSVDVRALFAFGRGAMAKTSSQQQQQMQLVADLEVDMMADMYRRMSNSCQRKCIPSNYREGELTKGESVCLDRCVAKYMDVHEKLGKKLTQVSMQDEQIMHKMQQQQAGK